MMHSLCGFLWDPDAGFHCLGPVKDADYEGAKGSTKGVLAGEPGSHWELRMATAGLCDAHLTTWQSLASAYSSSFVSTPNSYVIQLSVFTSEVSG